MDFPNTIPDEEFEIDGVYYTLQIVGFVKIDAPGTCGSITDTSTITDVFITEEDAENHACLFGRIIVAAPDISIDKTPDHQTADSGSSVEFGIEVVNTGDVELQNTALTDDECDALDGPYGEKPARRMVS